MRPTAHSAFGGRQVDHNCTVTIQPLGALPEPAHNTISARQVGAHLRAAHWAAQGAGYVGVAE
jgi:hypothetical protein